MAAQCTAPGFYIRYGNGTLEAVNYTTATFNANGTATLEFAYNAALTPPAPLLLWYDPATDACVPVQGVNGAPPSINGTIVVILDDATSTPRISDVFD